MFQNPGVGNVGLHNHCFEQGIEIISSVSSQVVQEKVFGLFVENATPADYLLVFGSGAAINLNAGGVQLPVVIDNPQGHETNWVQPLGDHDYYWYQHVDISNNLTGELYLQNVSRLFIYNGLKECIYVHHNGHFKIINRYLPVEIHCPVQFSLNYCSRVYLTGEENFLYPYASNYHYLPQLSAAEYLERRIQINNNL
jgi:hypothetical protein